MEFMGSGRRAGLEAALNRLVSRQHGVIGRQQALAAGLSKAAVDRRLASGAWVRVLPGVYRLPSAPVTWNQSLVASYLWAGDGAAVSHRSAAALLGFDGFEPGPLELTVPRRVRTPGLDLIVHCGVALPAFDLEEMGPLRVTDATRTLVDLASVVPMTTLEAALESALRRGQTSVRRLLWRLETLAPQGRRGSAAMRRCLAERGSSAPAESPLEVRLLRLLRVAGLPEPVRQFEVRDQRRILARLDLAYPEALLAIEADGYAHHSGRRDWLRDLRRRNRLTARGWRVLHVGWADLRDRPEEIIAAVRQVLADRG